MEPIIACSLLCLQRVTIRQRSCALPALSHLGSGRLGGGRSGTELIPLIGGIGGYCRFIEGSANALIVGLNSFVRTIIVVATAIAVTVVLAGLPKSPWQCVLVVVAMFAAAVTTVATVVTVGRRMVLALVFRAISSSIQSVDLTRFIQ